MTQNSRHDLFGWAVSPLPPFPDQPFAFCILPHVSADICFIVFHVLFEINNTPARVDPFFFPYFIRRARVAWRLVVAAFNFTYSRLPAYAYESNGNGIICFQLVRINRASNIWRGYFYRVSINPFQLRSSSPLFDAKPSREHRQKHDVRGAKVAKNSDRCDILHRLPDKKDFYVAFYVLITEDGKHAAYIYTFSEKLAHLDARMSFIMQWISQVSHFGGHSGLIRRLDAPRQINSLSCWQTVVSPKAKCV